MGMFSATEGEGRRKVGGTQDSREPRFSVLAGGMRVTGELISDSVIKIEGTVEGNVKAEAQVLVSKGGLVIGDIGTGEAIVGGEVRGSIVATNRIEVQSHAIVNGDITAPQIVVHEGGEINGLVRTKRPESPEVPDIRLEAADSENSEAAGRSEPLHPVGASEGQRPGWR